MYVEELVLQVGVTRHGQSWMLPSLTAKNTRNTKKFEVHFPTVPTLYTTCKNFPTPTLSKKLSWKWLLWASQNKHGFRPLIRLKMVSGTFTTMPVDCYLTVEGGVLSQMCSTRLIYHNGKLHLLGLQGRPCWKPCVSALGIMTAILICVPDLKVWCWAPCERFWETCYHRCVYAVYKDLYFVNYFFRI